MTTTPQEAVTEMPQHNELERAIMTIEHERQNWGRGYEELFEASHVVLEAAEKWNNHSPDSRPVQTTRDEWKDIISAPKDGTEILLFYPMRFCSPNKAIIGRWTRHNGGSWQGEGTSNTTELPSHWKYFDTPAAPTDGEMLTDLTTQPSNVKETGNIERDGEMEAALKALDSLAPTSLGWKDTPDHWSEKEAYKILFAALTKKSRG